MQLHPFYHVTYESGAQDQYTLKTKDSRYFVECIHYGSDGYLRHGMHRPFCIGNQQKGETGEVTEKQFETLRDFLNQYSDEADRAA